MKVRTLMTVTAVIAFLSGAGYVLLPQALLTFYGVRTDAAGIMLARFFGGSTLGIALFVWYARELEFTRFLFNILFVIFVTLCLAAVLVLDAVTAGVMNQLGWIWFVGFALLAIGFGYFRFVKRASS